MGVEETDPYFLCFGIEHNAFMDFRGIGGICHTLSRFILWSWWMMHHIPSAVSTVLVSLEWALPIPYVLFTSYSKSWHSYYRNFPMFNYPFKRNHFSNLFKDPSLQVHHFHLTHVLLDHHFQHLAQYLTESRHSWVNEWMSF